MIKLEQELPMKIYFTSLLIFSASFVFCQSKQLTIKQIDSIVTTIDSTTKYDSMIEDGTIEKTRKGIMKKIFVKKKAGGYSATYLSDPIKKKLKKISYDQSLDNFTMREYFYDNDSLIFVRSTIHKGTYDLNVPLSGQFYFQQGILIKKTGNDSLSKPIFLLKNGRRMLADYYDFKKLKR
jgi:hypothetical protein